MKNPEFKNSYLEEWQAILEAKDLSQALVLHFSYLADSPGYDRILEAVMRKAEGVQIFENCLLVDFPSDILFARPPASLERYQEWPKSFQELVSRHEFMELDESGLYLGDYREFDGYWVLQADKTIDRSSKILRAGLKTACTLEW
ncbi:hypothetical protein [Leptospira santarosai]|uniref:hypothetical protein n=1 Tax=Leptospira santarosai TaxID=28183 RepID=UPI0024AED06D|nr:hypothetical protein [Leptospira santarosai]MDI7225075.1 hypothetical protein [Leptospira santarosai]